MNTQFSADPYTGWKGEEDQGQLSAFLVLNGIGLFQMVAVVRFGLFMK